MKALYRALEENNLSRASLSLVWLGLAPPRVEAFCWLAIATRICTTNNLRRRGLTGSTISEVRVMCRKEVKSVNHLFIHCEIEVSVWARFISRCGAAWCFPEKIGEAIESWMGGHFAGCGRTLWRMASFAIIWSIWRERNDRIFRGSSSFFGRFDYFHYHEDGKVGFG